MFSDTLTHIHISKKCPFVVILLSHSSFCVFQVLFWFLRRILPTQRPVSRGVLSEWRRVHYECDWSSWKPHLRLSSGLQRPPLRVPEKLCLLPQQPLQQRGDVFTSSQWPVQMPLCPWMDRSALLPSITSSLLPCVILVCFLTRFIFGNMPKMTSNCVSVFDFESNSIFLSFLMCR